VGFVRPASFGREGIAERIPIIGRRQNEEKDPTRVEKESGILTWLGLKNTIPENNWPPKTESTSQGDLLFDQLAKKMILFKKETGGKKASRIFEGGIISVESRGVSVNRLRKFGRAW